MSRSILSLFSNHTQSWQWRILKLNQFWHQIICIRVNSEQSRLPREPVACVLAAVFYGRRLLWENNETGMSYFELWAPQEPFPAPHLTSPLSTFTLILFFLGFPVGFQWLFSIILLAVGRIARTLHACLPLRLLLLDILNYLCGDGFKCIFDAQSRLGTGLKELHAILLGSFFALLLAYYSLILHVTLVPQQYFLHAWLRMLIYLADPVLDIVEALLARRVIRQNDSLSSSIIRLRYRPEPLLPGRVPYLHFYIFPVQLNCIYFEVDAWEIERNQVWVEFNFDKIIKWKP